MTQTKPANVVRVRLLTLDENRRPDVLLLDEITDPMSAYEHTRAEARRYCVDADRGVLQRFEAKMTDLVDRPRPVGDESHLRMVANPVLGLMWAITWPGSAATDPDFA